MNAPRITLVIVALLAFVAEPGQAETAALTATQKTRPVPNAAKSAKVALPAAAPPQRVVIPHTDYAVTVGAGAPAQRGSPPAPALLQAIATWLSVSFGLPGIDSLPAVRLERTERITTFHFTGILSDDPRDMALVPKGQREVVAAYDPLAQAIYLPERWTGSSADELSMLVHEMVHHVQLRARMRYECAQASERLAYDAQEKWLQMFGRSLDTAFQIDPFTLLVSTRCFV